MDKILDIESERTTSGTCISTESDDGVPTHPPVARRPPTLHRMRSIDDLYDDAHNELNAKLFCRSSPYFMCFLALALANVGGMAAFTSIGYLLAFGPFEEVSQGKDGLIASSVYMGALLSGLLAGPASDISGRRKVLLFGQSVTSVTVLCIAFSTAAWNLVLCRFCAGIGIGSFMACSPALISEHSPPTYRGRYSNFVEAFWTVGSIYASVMAWLLLGQSGSDKEENWRTYAASIAVPSIFALVLTYCYVPESARFLALHGRYEEAIDVTRRISNAMSFRGRPLSTEEILHQFPAEATRNVSADFYSSLCSARDSYASLYKTSTSRKKMLVVQAKWYFVFLGYEVSVWIVNIFKDLPFIDSAYTMALFFALSSVPGLFVSGRLVDRVSRTRLLQGALLMTLLTLSACATLALATDSGIVVVVVSCIFNSSLVICWSVLSLATSENFPTQQRSAVMGICTSTGMLGHITMNLLSGFFLENGWSSGPLILGDGVSLHFVWSSIDGEALSPRGLRCIFSCPSQYY